MAEDIKVLRCIILTLKKENVIVPSAAVAEIVAINSVQSVDDAPAWLPGKMDWRGLAIPLISFEAAGDETEVGESAHKQAAILYALNGKLKTPYMAIIISGVPHVSTISNDQIKTNMQTIVSNPMVAQKVRVNGASASILDLDAMENMLVEAGLS